MTLLVLYVSLALGFSFLCSVMEAVLLSLTPSFVAELETRRPGLGGRLRAFKDDIDRPLAAILSLNTIAHTVGAAGAGAQAIKVFGDAYVGLISAVLTFLILVLSEIIPKTLGAVYWRQLTPVTARLLQITIWSMWPLVVMAKSLTRLLAHGKREVLVSREELAAMAELGAREGVVDEGESRILANLFRFRGITARDVMTPRTVIIALPESQTVAETVADTVAKTVAGHKTLRVSRIPLYDRDHDDLKGFVLKTDILLRAAEQRGDTPLGELRRPLLVVPESMPLPTLFELLVNQRAHIAQVVDEYGGTAGLVTMEDVLETLLGLEIVDEVDRVHDMQEWARQQWRKRAAELGLPLGEDGEKN